MKVGQDVYCLVVGDDNKYHPLKCSIRGKEPSNNNYKISTNPKEIEDIMAWDYKVKCENGTWTTMPGKYLYETKEWAQMVADNYNRQLPL